MRFSEMPHVAYMDKDGNGPGCRYLGDVERWNWRYALIGVENDLKFDEALLSYFNDAQRNVMKREPVQALEFLRTHLPSLVNEGVVSRMLEAQARHDAKSIISIESNVIKVNFRA